MYVLHVSHVLHLLHVSVSMHFEWGDVICCQSEFHRLDSVGSVKSWGIFNFSRFNPRVSQPIELRLELATEIAHRGGTDSKHVGYLRSD